MQYKNIIFDLGNVLVKLNPEGCIGAFKAIGMGGLANHQSRWTSLHRRSEGKLRGCRETGHPYLPEREVGWLAFTSILTFPSESKLLLKGIRMIYQMMSGMHRAERWSSSLDPYREAWSSGVPSVADCWWWMFWEIWPWRSPLPSLLSV